MCHVPTIDVIFIIIYVCLHVENHRRFPGARPGGSLAKVCAKRGELFTSSRFPEGSGPLEKKLPAPRAQLEKTHASCDRRAARRKLSQGVREAREAFHVEPIL